LNFLDQLKIWAEGDASQGKVMFVFGIIIFLLIIFILKGNNTLLKGMVIPLSLLCLISSGYGGYLAFTRPATRIVTVKNYKTNSKETIQAEITKAKADNKNYKNLRPIWGILIFVSLVTFYLVSKDYYKGISLGFIFLFSCALLIDSLLHHRLKPYLKILEDLS